MNVTSDAITIDLKDGQYISFEGFELVEYVEPAPGGEGTGGEGTGGEGAGTGGEGAEGSGNADA